jgi:hypothetical protein
MKQKRRQKGKERYNGAEGWLFWGLQWNCDRMDFSIENLEDGKGV